MTIHEQLATAFGIGRTPYTPGTAASLVAVIVAVPIMYFLGWLAILALALAATAVGVWVSEVYALDIGKYDPQECVIDEFAGQWLTLALAGLGAYLEGEPVGLVGYLLAFLLFRLFDIAKPWPISKAESLKGGLGIMADDVAAGIVAGVVVFLFTQSGFL